jgi:transketolase
MRFDPQDPIWPNRDRFVLSNGHASMLLWSILHLTGVQAVNADYENLGQPSVTLDDIRRFRQLDSKAPGHPEYHWVSGVETTTGPLGQGVATSVGMAIAQNGSPTDTTNQVLKSSTTTSTPSAVTAA